jgi:hypothetical protein
MSDPPRASEEERPADSQLNSSSSGSVSSLNPKKLANDAVQRLADSEPTDTLSIEDYLKLLPTLSADELTRLTVFHFQQLCRAIKEDR